MNAQTKQIVLYAVIATALFVAIYVFYSKSSGKAVAAGDEEPTGKENVPPSDGAGYEKPSESEREN